MSATIISAPPPRSAPSVRSAFADKELYAGNGYVMLGIGLVLIAVSGWLAYTGFVAGQSLVRAWITLPAIIFAIAMLSSAGLPLLNGFIGEFTILQGAFEANRIWAAFAVERSIA